MKPIRGIGRALKALTAMVFGRPSVSWVLPRSRRDYRSEVGDGLGSSVIAGPVRWICRTFPEAPMVLRDPDDEVVRDNPLLDLMRRPNEHYSGRVLWMATLCSLALDGNAYWLIIRGANDGGIPRELWYVPWWMMEPKIPDGDRSTYISHYEYRPGGVEPVRAEVEDVVHFRDGLDPHNTRKGSSPLKAILREIFTDDEAATFTAGLLANMGVPGLVISPDDDSGVVSDEDANETKLWWKQRFRGDQRGEPLVMTGKTRVEQFGFNPQQMDLKALRRIPEERVTSALGVPAIVAGLGAGLDRCLPGDARVWTTSGAVPLRDVRRGARVWSIVDGKLTAQMVTNAGPATPRPVYEIRTKNRTLRASGNHPILCRRAGRMGGGNNDARRISTEYVLAENLRPGDYVVQPKALPDQGGTQLPSGSPTTVELMSWLGAMIGDGSVTGSAIRIAMPPDDRCHVHYAELATKLFTRQARQSGGDQAYQETLPRVPVTVAVRERDFGFRSAAGARELTRLGVTGRAKTKRVPAWIYGLSRELRLAFLAGIVDSDGYIDKRGVLSITLCNEALVHDLRDLLIGCGIQCSNVGEGQVRAEALPNPGLHSVYHYWCFAASAASAIAAIPFADARYRERVEANSERGDPSGFDAVKAGLDPDTLGFYRVSSIRVLDPEPLYDLEVAGGGHNFVADGVVVSNSTFANFAEAREAAYEQCIIPLQNLVAEELWAQLLPEFIPDPTGWVVAFDLSKVRVLQEDENKRSERIRLEMTSGLVTQAEARAQLNYDVLPEHERYYLPLSVVIMPAGLLEPEVAPVPPALRENAEVDEEDEPVAAGVFGSAIKAKASAGVLFVPPGKNAALSRRMLLDWKELSQAWIPGLMRQFNAWGEAIAAAYLALEPTLPAVAAAGRKDDENAIALSLMRAQEALDPLDYSEQYVRVLERTLETVNTVVGLGVNMPDAAELQIVAEGGKRLGLIDMSAQTRQAMFGALRTAREAGEGPPATARRIRDGIAAGPWGSVQTRATVIARTETKFAQNASSLAVYREADTVRQVQVVDAQLGDTDADCEFQNGRIVSFEEAQALAVDEHPNGTRSFSPVVDPELRAAVTGELADAKLAIEALTAQTGRALEDAKRQTERAQDRSDELMRLLITTQNGNAPVQRQLRIVRDGAGNMAGAEILEQRGTSPGDSDS